MVMDAIINIPFLCGNLPRSPHSTTHKHAQTRTHMIDFAQLVAPFVMEFLGTLYLCLTVALALGLPDQFKPLAPIAIGVVLVSLCGSV